MISIDTEGMFISPSIRPRRFRSIEHGNLDPVKAIVIHQTDSSSAHATFNSYHSGGNGAHLLIDKNGIIFQTASILKRCYHVGRLIKSRCLELRAATCSDPNLAKAKAMGWSAGIRMIDQVERAKGYPDRFPVNNDSIGIELVGSHIDDTSYETITSLQDTSLRWLLGELYHYFSIGSDDTFRHPEISYKNPGEAASARW